MQQKSAEVIKKSHTRQLDQLDCGVACLLSVIRYYDGDSNFERIRRQCGADLTGTTLLGLKEAATHLGFEADGFQADVPSLIEHGQPTILHVELDGSLQHYVIWYSEKEGVHLIGDPARGVIEWTTDELRKHWQSGNCLVLKPTERFVSVGHRRSAQKEWFLNILRQDFPILAVSAGIGVLIAALGLAMSIYSQQLIDKILPSKQAEKIIISTVLVVVLLLARVGLSVLRGFLMLRQSKELGTRLNNAFYEPLLKLPKSFFDTRKIGDFVARLNDTQRIQHTVSVLAGGLLIDLLLVLTAFGLLFYYDWHIGLLSLLILPIYFWLIYRKNKSIVEAQTKVMVSYSLSESNYINTIQGIADVKNKNKQAFFSDINRVLYGTFQEMLYQSGIIQTRLSASAGVASVLFIAAVLVITIYQVQHNHLKIGEMTAILGVISTLLPSVTNLALVSVPFNEAKVAFDRMYEFVNVPIENPSLSHPAGQHLEFDKIEMQNLTFRFAGKAPLLNGINFGLKKGEITAIVGESGGGKSMLCQLLQKFYEPESGQILVNGSTHLSSIDTSTWRDVIGVVPQQVHLFNGTVIDNICFGTTPQEIEKAFKQLEDYGFMPFFEKLPQGLFTVLGEEGVNLSGGQRQIIGLARALSANPQLLILDEATAALDRHTERFVLDLLLKLKSQMGILLITHRLHTLKAMCDKIYVLDKGTFAHIGTHQHLLASQNMYSDYWKEWEN